MLALQDSPARQFLQQLGKSLPRPRAILVASAHWEIDAGTAVSFTEQPATIHDFGGFPEALYALQYPAPGAPDLAAHIVELFNDANIPVASAPRGLDHGAWVPLRLMYPDADIPVTQIALMRGASATQHQRFGAALSILRQQGILVIGSGSLTHNLAEFRGREFDAPAPSWVTDFSTWMHTSMSDLSRASQSEALQNYRALAPAAVRNHPTEEHLMPLFVALGAAGVGARATRLHDSVQFGILAMDVYAFS